MNAFNKIFTATEEFFSTIPIRQISRHINLTTCSGSSVRHVFGKFITFILYPYFILDQDVSLALRKIADSVGTWADYIRVDPDDLINDEPYNIIIFQPPVRPIFSIFSILRYRIRMQQTKNMLNISSKIHFKCL